jgi:PPOX class probable F420-dependent enzyme
VPVVFAIDSGNIVTAVDSKPKRPLQLARVSHIIRDPRVSFLADHYSDDWSALWWVRIDGLASLEQTGDGFERGIAALIARYQQYQKVAIPGPLIRILPTRFSSWSATPT